MEIKKGSAIILGNGLNNYQNMSSKETSWKDLLISLSAKQDIQSYLELENISYPEVFDMICFLEGETEKRYKNLKPGIIAKIKEWQSTDTHKNFTDFCIKNNIPILTTNYDTTLVTEELMKENKRITKCSRGKKYSPQKIAGKSFSDFYPWFSYYSNHKISDVLDEFGIWHIHGFWFYKRSLSIGASDYASNIARLNRFLYSNEGLYKTDLEKWRGKDSWLDIFFHKDLFIIGLSLDEQETSLRWLLMERERYFRKFPERCKKTVYVYSKENSELLDKKRIFLKILNIEVLEFQTYEEIYSSWSIEN